MKPSECSTGKKKYSSKKQAIHDAKMLKTRHLRPGFAPMAYPCKKCRHWHVGNSDLEHSR